MLQIHVEVFFFVSVIIIISRINVSIRIPNRIGIYIALDISGSSSCTYVSIRFCIDVFVSIRFLASTSSLVLVFALAVC